MAYGPNEEAKAADKIIADAKALGLRAEGESLTDYLARCRAERDAKSGRELQAACTTGTQGKEYAYVDVTCEITIRVSVYGTVTHDRGSPRSYSSGGSPPSTDVEVTGASVEESDVFAAIKTILDQAMDEEASADAIERRASL